MFGNDWYGLSYLIVFILIQMVHIVKLLIILKGSMAPENILVWQIHIYHNFGNPSDYKNMQEHRMIQLVNEHVCIGTQFKYIYPVPLVCTNELDDSVSL